MQDITLKIKEENIVKYLEKHKSYYRHYEPLFIKYLKDNYERLTEETLEILTDGKVFFENKGELPSFDPRPSNIQNLDFSGICHILIPTIRYYDSERNTISTSRLYGNASTIALKVGVAMLSTFEVIDGVYTPPINNAWDIVENTVDDYRICKKISYNKESDIVVFKMTRGHAERELSIYADFYGIDKVKQIGKIIREGVR